MRPNGKRTVIALAVAVIAVAAAVVWVTPGGTTRFDPRTYRGKTGKIVVPFKGESVLYLLNNRSKSNDFPEIIELRTKNGTITAPVGSYRPYVYYAVIRRNGRIAWTAKSQLSSHDRITIKDKATQRLAVGPPVSVSMKVSQQGRTAYMSVESVGRGGEQCTIEGAGTPGEAPAFQVLSKDGKLLWSGKFSYG